MPSTERIKPTTYAQLLVPAVTFIIVIATISVLLIFLLQNCTRNQMNMQSLPRLQPFVFFVGQVTPATTSSSAVVLQGNSSQEELHFPELLVQLSFCAGGERQHVHLGGHRYSCCRRICLPVAAISSRKLSGPVLPLVQLCTTGRARRWQQIQPFTKRAIRGQV